MKQNHIRSSGILSSFLQAALAVALCRGIGIKAVLAEATERLNSDLEAYNA